ncbi:unnamed protein product [Camellia sinensis]
MVFQAKILNLTAVTKSLHHQWLHRRHLHLRRCRAHRSQSFRRPQQPRHPTRRCHHALAPQFSRIRVLLPRRIVQRHNYYHSQPVLHSCRDRKKKTSESIQGETHYHPPPHRRRLSSPRPRRLLLHHRRNLRLRHRLRHRRRTNNPANPMLAQRPVDRNLTGEILRLHRRWPG